MLFADSLHHLFLPATVLGSPSLTCQSNMYSFQHCMLSERPLGIARRLLKQTDDYELRMYDVYPFVTTPYERRDEGYLALGSYMEGRNADSAKMNLTQPIMMRYEPATVSAWQSLETVHSNLDLV